MPYEGDQYCFACGQNNPIGLKLHFDFGEDGATTEFTPERVYQGYPGIMHGGLVMTLLDETMAYAVISSAGQPAVTGELRVRLRGQGVPVGRLLRVRGWVTGRRGRLVKTEGELRGEDGTLLASGEGKFMLVEG